MLKIRNKLESLKTVKQLGLNTMPIEYFETYNKELLDDFFKRYDYKYYVVRDFGKASSNFFRFNISKKEVYNHVKNAKQFVVNVSTYNFQGHQICTGAIIIKRNMQVSLSVRCEDNCSVRQAEVDPQFSFTCDIDDKRLDDIDGLDQVIDYVFKKNLFDVMVEFASMDIPVGTNQEKVVVFELRTEY